MAKSLAIALAGIAGAVAVWLLVPSEKTYQLAPISLLERHERAEALIGQPFRYVTEDFARDFNWFWKQGPQAIDLAMDECDIIMSSTLFNRHVAAMLERGLSVKQTTINDFAEPPLAHVKTCLDLQAGYSRLIGREYPF
jgi:hypothetical protein